MGRVGLGVLLALMAFTSSATARPTPPVCLAMCLALQDTDNAGGDTSSAASTPDAPSAAPSTQDAGSPSNPDGAAASGQTDSSAATTQAPAAPPAEPDATASNPASSLSSNDVTTTTSSDTPSGVIAAGMVGVIFLILIGATFYLIPSVIAFARDSQYKWAILALDIFLGWTLIGWVAALVWALMPKSPDASWSVAPSFAGYAAQPSAPPGPRPAYQDSHAGLSAEQMSALERLSQLRQSGVLTEEEFIAQKAQIVNAI